MSAGRARVAAAALVALFLWPFAHFALVKHYDLSPWKFMGFAMYCRPNLPIAVDAYMIGDGRRTLVPPASIPHDGQRLISAFCRERQILGKLRDPLVLAAWFFRTRSDVDAVAFVVRHQRIDPKSGLVIEDEVPYVYRRPGVVGAPAE